METLVVRIWTIRKMVMAGAVPVHPLSFASAIGLDSTLARQFSITHSHQTICTRITHSHKTICTRIHTLTRLYALDLHTLTRLYALEYTPSPDCMD